MLGDKLTGIDYQLDNWRREGKDRYPQRITPSLEGRYRAEAGDVLEQDISPPSLPVNVKQAEHIESLVIQLPYKNKICIVAAYMYPQVLRGNSFYKFCRMIGITPNQFEPILQKSKLMIENKL